MSIAMTAMSLMIGCIGIVVCWKSFKLALKLVEKCLTNSEIGWRI